MTKTTRSSWLLACLGVVSLACIARLYQVTQPVLWLDEAYSVTLAAMPLEQIIWHTARDVHPPLYYLLLHYWMQAFGDSVLAVRGMSVLFGCLSVIVAIRMASLLADRKVALISGLLLALLPVAVRYSQEARMYALTGFLLLAATLMLMRWAMRPDRHRFLVGYGLLVTAALYSHYFSIFAVASHWFYVLSCARSQGLQLIRSRAWWLCNVSIALGFLPWLPSLWGQFGHTNAYWVVWIPEVTLQTLPSTLWLFFALGAGQDFGRGMFWLVPLLILAASLFAVARDPYPMKPAALIFAVSYVPLLLVWLGSFNVSVYVIRYLSFAGNGMPVLLALTIGRLLAQTRLWGLALLVCLIWQGAGLHRLYTEQNNLNGTPDWRGIRLDAVLEQLQRQWQAGDVIVVGNSFWYLTVHYYNKTASEVLIFDEGKRGDNSGTHASSFGWKSLFYPQSEQILVPDLSKLVSSSGRIWWIDVKTAQGAEQRLPDTWVLKEQFTRGKARATLFAQATPQAAVSPMCWLASDKGNATNGAHGVSRSNFCRQPCCSWAGASTRNE